MKHKEEKHNQSEQQEEKRIPPNEDSISSLWDNFKRSNICIIGVPEGEEKEQEIGNLVEKIMKENYLNGEGNRNASPVSTESPTQDGCKAVHSKTRHN